ADAKHDRDRRGRRFCSERCGRAICDDHAHPAADQIGRQLRQPIITAFRPAVFDRHILTLDVAFFTEALPERGQIPYPKIYRDAVEKPYHRHCCLLRARCTRPRCCRAAEQRDEFATLHSITSSAPTRRPGGTVRPSAFAVLRLTTNSNFTACCTGKSAGFP